MQESFTFSEFVKIFFLWVNPVIFVVGIALILLTQEKFDALEKRLRTNIGVFQKLMLKRKNLVGVLFIIYSLVSFFIIAKA